MVFTRSVFARIPSARLGGRRGSLPGAGVEISIGAAALSMWDCGRWFVVVWSLGVGSCPAVMWWPLLPTCQRSPWVVRGRCGLVAVGALQRCARPTASVARILHRLTRPVLCRVPVRCAPLLPTCQRCPWLVRGGGVRDWSPWFGCHRRGSLPWPLL